MFTALVKGLRQFLVHQPVRQVSVGREWPFPHSTPPLLFPGRRPAGRGSAPWVFADLAYRSSHERHDRPAAQHAEQIDDDRYESDGLRDAPGEEFDRDDVPVLQGEDTDRRKEGQEDDRLNVSHRCTAELRG
jgi:hypothetical protein